jgi:hypothetical protein
VPFGVVQHVAKELVVGELDGPVDPHDDVVPGVEPRHALRDLRRHPRMQVRSRFDDRVHRRVRRDVADVDVTERDLLADQRVERVVAAVDGTYHRHPDTHGCQSVTNG